nr:classical arabinogalactan protein 9-like [Lolium perenne]
MPPARRPRRHCRPASTGTAAPTTALPPTHQCCSSALPISHHHQLLPPPLALPCSLALDHGHAPTLSLEPPSSRTPRRRICRRPPTTNSRPRHCQRRSPALANNLHARPPLGLPPPTRSKLLHPRRIKPPPRSRPCATKSSTARIRRITPADSGLGRPPAAPPHAAQLPSRPASPSTTSSWPILAHDLTILAKMTPAVPAT